MHKRFPILLVDDDPAIGDILNRAAEHVFPESRFYQVSSFDEAQRYLTNIEGQGPRLILLDLNLHVGADGLDFLKLVKAHPQGRYIPVVMLSGSGESNKVKEAYNLGAASFTSKPFSYQDWKSYVKQLRDYWFESVTIPLLWFEKDSDE